MICGENFDVMNQPDILSGRVKPRVGRVEIFNPSAPLLMTVLSSLHDELCRKDYHNQIALFIFEF